MTVETAGPSAEKRNSSTEDIAADALSKVDAVAAVHAGLRTRFSRPYLLTRASRSKPLTLFNFLFHRSSYRHWLRGRLPPLIWSRCGASEIRFRTNAIGIYRRQKRVVKVFRGMSYVRKNLDGNEAFRRIEPQFFTLPRIIAHGGEPFAFLIEELLSGKEEREPMSLSRGQIEDLCRFHCDGISMQSLSLAREHRDFYLEAAATLSLPESERKMLVALLRRNRYALLLGQCHGDCRPANLLTRGRKPHALIDWEAYFKGSIGR